MKKLNAKDIPEDFPATAIWRGKHSTSGTWIYGFFQMYSGIPEIQSVKVARETVMPEPGSVYTIDPETLSQCTGEIDKRGDLYFFGDLAKFDDGSTFEIMQVNRGGIYISQVREERPIVVHNEWEISSAEITGTIWDDGES